MDGEPLQWLYHRLLHDPTLRHRAGCTYGDGVVLFVYFLAVLFGRSLLWASKRKHWPIWCRAALRSLPMPSYSQLNRRLKSDAAAALITGLNEELRGQLPRGNEKVVDGKPLVVGVYSHDPQAAWGKLSADGWAKGYKLHVIIDAASAAIDAWELTPLNAGEATVLRKQLIPRVDLHDCTLRGDANYDSNPTYRAVADAGGRHVAPRRKPGTGLGHHSQHPDRIRAVGELEQPTPPGRPALALADHKRRRNRVEQVLGHLCMLPWCGLSALPPFVRRLTRVHLWVAAKITLYHLHLVQALAAQRAAA